MWRKDLNQQLIAENKVTVICQRVSPVPNRYKWIFIKYLNIYVTFLTNGYPPIDIYTKQY